MHTCLSPKHSPSLPRFLSCSAHGVLSRAHGWQAAAIAQEEVKRQDQEREKRRRRREGRVAATSPSQSTTTYDTEPINPYRSPRLASLASAAEYQKMQSLAGENGPPQPESSRRALSPKRSSSGASKAGNVAPTKSGSVRSSPRASAVASPSSSSSKKPKSAGTALEASSHAGSGSSPKKSPRGGVSRVRYNICPADHPQQVFCLSVAVHVLQCVCI